MYFWVYYPFNVFHYLRFMLFSCSCIFSTIFGSRCNCHIKPSHVKLLHFPPIVLELFVFVLAEMEAAISASAQSDSFPAGLPVHLWHSFLSQPDGAMGRYFIQPPLITFHWIWRVKTQKLNDWYNLCPCILAAGGEVLLNITPFVMNNSHGMYFRLFILQDSLIDRWRRTGLKWITEVSGPFLLASSQRSCPELSRGSRTSHQK